MTANGLLDGAAAICLLLGAALTLVAAIGMLRLPDLLSRMHAGTKPQVLGLLLALLGLGLALRQSHVVGLLLIVALFQLITSPIVSHMVGRAFYRGGAMNPELLIINDLAEGDPEPPGSGGRRSPTRS